jgi:hypothetical protein
MQVVQNFWIFDHASVYSWFRVNIFRFNTPQYACKLFYQIHFQK